jgi:uncharacterized membrane protein
MNNYLQQYWLTSQSIFGLIHFATAILGLILGLGILFLKPGTKTHKVLGYIFIPDLLIVNISALFIHEMGMTFGPFHYIIPFSLFSLFFGIIPFWIKIEQVKKLRSHIMGMTGAALGLWAAFCAELVARTPALSNFLLKISSNSFWVATAEGFFFVLLFTFIINKVQKHQFKRLGIDKK